MVIEEESEEPDLWLELQRVASDELERSGEDRTVGLLTRAGDDGGLLD